MTRPTKWAVHPVKTQLISMGICPVWSESLLSAWRNLGSLTTHWAHCEDTDQTWRMPRLIWVFAGAQIILLILSCGSSNNVSILLETLIVMSPQPKGSGDILLLVRIPSVLLIVYTLSPEPMGGFWPTLQRGGKKWLDSGVHDLIFKVTLALWNFDPKKLVCTLSLEPNERFWPNFLYCNVWMVLRFV